MGQEDTLEKEMATYYSILAREISWTENTMGYSPCGHRRVTHDLATKQQLESHALRESTVICQL